MPTVERYKFSDRFLQGLKPAESGGLIRYWDTQLANFCVEVTPTNTSFVVQGRIDGKQLWRTVGRYPRMGLVDARQKAREMLDALAHGVDPKAEQKTKTVDGSFAGVAEEYMAAALPTLRTGRDTEQMIRRVLLKSLGDRPVADINRHEVLTLMEKIRDSGKLIPGTRRMKGGGLETARKALSSLSQIIDWALDHERRTEVNPCVGIRKRLGPQKVRDRVLSDNELRSLWPVFQAEGQPNGVLLQILLLTGQRESEWAEAKWSEIDLNQTVLIVPQERMKAKPGYEKSHLVPLTPKVAELLRSLPQSKPDGYVFSMTGGDTPVNGFDRMKQRIDRKCPLPAWVFHDLRRTVSTNMARFDVPDAHAEAVLAHSQRGIRRNYNHWKYHTQKRAALETWERELLAIVGEFPPVGKPLAQAG